MPLDDLAEYLRDCLHQEYDYAVDNLPHDEGSYWGAHWDTWDLLVDELELELPRDDDSSLLKELSESISDQLWCKADPFRLDSREVARFSWDAFCDITKHHRRFFFADYDPNPDSGSDPEEVYHPSEVLRLIFEYAQQAGLVKQTGTGKHLFRARWEGTGHRLESAAELGPPPSDRATQSNRMSPPGIVMLYACDDEETALRETATRPGRFAVGKFKVLRPMVLLDLTDIPTVPSLFECCCDNSLFLLRKALIFLRYVADQISRPIERDDRVHVDYVPTQVVTEYVRSQLTWENKRVDGIKYPSAVHRGHASYVLFATPVNVIPAELTYSFIDTWLQLVEVTHRTVSLRGDPRLP